MSPRKRCLPTLLVLMVSMRLFGARAAEPCTVIIVSCVDRLSDPVPERRNCISEFDTLELYRGERFYVMCDCWQFNAQGLLCMNYWLGSTLIESIDYISYSSFNGTEQMLDVKEWQARNSSCSNIKPEVVQRQQGISDPYLNGRFMESNREGPLLTVNTANLTPATPSVMRFACEAYDSLTQVSVMSPPSCKVNIITDPCLSDPCLNGAQCLPRGGDYDCVCRGDANIGKQCHRANAENGVKSGISTQVDYVRIENRTAGHIKVETAGRKLRLRCQATDVNVTMVRTPDGGAPITLKEVSSTQVPPNRVEKSYDVVSPKCQKTDGFRCTASSGNDSDWKDVNLSTTCPEVDEKYILRKAILSVSIGVIAALVVLLGVLVYLLCVVIYKIEGTQDESLSMLEDSD